MTSIQEWLDRLQGVRKAGSGYKALCPAHDDKNPSLSVTEGDDGKVLVKCYSGCTFNAVREALWPQGAAVGTSKPAAPRSSASPTPKAPQSLPGGSHDTVNTYHYADGSVAFASVRREPPGKAKRFSQWTPADDDGGLWHDKNPLKTLPLYRLPQIMGAEKVVIVEGEKCVHAVLDAWPDMAVTTFGGGSGSWRKTDYSPLAGKDVSIWADADAPGHTASLDIAAHLATLDCRVRVALPELDGGSDIADWLAVGKGYARDKLASLLRDYEPEPQLEPTPGPEPELGYLDKIASTPYYRVLGLVGDAVAIRISAGRVLQRTRESLTQPSTLIAIAPLAWWSGVMGDGEALSTSQSRKLGDSLLRAADRLGQFDMSAIYGSGGVRLPSGQIVYHLGDRLLVDGQERSLDDDAITWQAEKRIHLAPSATDAQCQAIARAVMDYRWFAPTDGRRWLGWMVSAITGGALKWRQHMQITAPSGSGKSWLLSDVLAPLMGPLLQRIADASPAALARLSDHTSLPFAFDEAEPGAEWILELLSLMRVSSGGAGKRIRVDMQTGGVQEQEPRFSALLSNVSAPALTRADASRIVNVRLGAAVGDWSAVQSAIASAMVHADGVRSRIIRDTPAIAAQVDAVAQQMQSKGLDTRESMASAALSVGWWWWGINGDEVGISDGDDRDRTDASDCLAAIMSITLRDPGGASKTLAQALLRDAGPIADLYGVRYDVPDGLHVGFGHPGLSGGLRGTRWEKANLRSTLMQLDGATLTSNALRLGNRRLRCVLIPPSTLFNAGIEIGVLGE